MSATRLMLQEQRLEFVFLVPHVLHMNSEVAGFADDFEGLEDAEEEAEEDFEDGIVMLLRDPRWGKVHGDARKAKRSILRGKKKDMWTAKDGALATKDTTDRQNGIVSSKAQKNEFQYKHAGKMGFNFS
ncbi:hypothetical protein MKZ38_009484 [Zalerion maritima]|uniref:Uncharacterized protein n=1 Tax=Zalerion maritima TaxID=339359 RepID=A0AAD5WNJ5_9PEZI|nr:hypothetical protein MKZ38_009484 [Zalerion maritima]